MLGSFKTQISKCLLSTIKYKKQIIPMQILSKLNKFFSAALKVPKYLTHQNLFHLQTQIDQFKKTDTSVLISCIETIFHSQGGGQSDDKAWIKLQNTEAHIPIIRSNKVYIQEKSTIFYEIQRNENTQKIRQNMKIEMIIDSQYRTKMMKLHTAGHLIDLAMTNLIKQISYGKCGHFPDNSFVQYSIDKEGYQNIPQLKQKLQSKILQLIDKKIEVQKDILSLEQAVNKKVIPDKQSWKGQNFVRVVKIGQSWCCCGGTHLKNTFQLKDKINIKKITNKQKTPQKIKISYQIC